MSEYCVVVAGGAQARIFTLEPAELPEMESGPNLVERQALSNPQHQARDAEIYADHRVEHDKEVNRKFARDVAAEVGRLMSRNGYQHLVVCADPRTLGMLRPNLSDAINGEIRVHEVARDLNKLTSRDLHERLASTGHLPRRKGRRRA